MIQNLQLGTFRGLSDLKFERFQGINLLVGDNNSGKTSILEAVGLLGQPLNSARWGDIARLRGEVFVLSAIWGMFPGSPPFQADFETVQSNPIQLSGDINGQHRDMTARATLLKSWETGQVEMSLAIQCNNPGQNSSQEIHFAKGASAGPLLPEDLRCISVTTHTHRSIDRMMSLLSHAIEEQAKSEVLTVIQLLDPQIIDIDNFLSGSRKQVLITHRSRGVVDLFSFGNGVSWVAMLSMAIIHADDRKRGKSGILLVDELEIGIHSSMLSPVLTLLLQQARIRNVQLFATTHSLEMVDSILEAESDNRELVAFFLAPKGHPTPVICYNYDKLILVRSHGMDIR